MTPAETAGAGDPEMRLERLLADAVEVPEPQTAVKIAAAHADVGDLEGARHWLRRCVEAGDDLRAWLEAARLVDRLTGTSAEAGTVLRVAVVGSHTVDQYADMLRVAMLARGLDTRVRVAPYGQVFQEILDPDSGLYRWAPDLIVVVVAETDLELPWFSDDPEDEVRRELHRWSSLVEIAVSRTRAPLLLHGFAPRPETAFGHLAGGLPGSRHAMVAAVNRGLPAVLAQGAALIDCAALAARFGTDRWIVDRYWFAARQAVALDALPLLARHTAAVAEAVLGRARKCLVLDLDGTLWGGSIGEVGLDGIELGHGPRGEAYVAFQEHVLALRRRGILLAVCSKNDEKRAREPFERHPAMRIRDGDIACFVANWEPKPRNLVRIAEELGIGLDALVFVDDDPAERELVRRTLPAVDVVTLPADPSGYRRTLAGYLGFESVGFTPEDARRTELYRARAESLRLRAAAPDLPSFWRNLRMAATILPADASRLARIAQLVGKTNQFNLTTRRHGEAALRAFLDDSRCVFLTVDLRDRIADHGLVAVLIAFQRDATLEVDTWLMSCRVLGRTVEEAILGDLCDRARARGCVEIRGSYRPNARNGLVADLYERLGFAFVEEATDGTTTWRLELGGLPPIRSAFISVEGSRVDA